MSDKKPATCKAAECGGEIIPGTRFCWRPHSPVAPKVGEFHADHGQLLWKTVEDRASRLQERLLAVTLDGAQVFVESVEEEAESKPARLRLSVRDAASASAPRSEVVVELSKLLELMVSGSESVAAAYSRSN